MKKYFFCIIAIVASLFSACECEDLTTFWESPDPFRVTAVTHELPQTLSIQIFVVFNKPLNQMTINTDNIRFEGMETLSIQPTTDGFLVIGEIFNCDTASNPLRCSVEMTIFSENGNGLLSSTGETLTEGNYTETIVVIY